VFGLLRVVGSLLAQQLPPDLPLQFSCLGVYCLSGLWVCCVAYLSYGIVLVDRSCLRLVSLAWHQMNFEVASLHHVVNACVNVVAH
jgi:hypothetical protein